MKKCLTCCKKLQTQGGSEYHSDCAKEVFESNQAPVISYSLDEMAKLAKLVVERSVAIPGVQPKLSMTLDTGGKDSRLTLVGALGGKYILKPPSPEFPQMPENEHLTMRMAEVFGIRTVPNSLIRLKSGELSYITKRIDRTENEEKIHMLDMFQLLESYDKYKGTINKIGKVLATHSSKPQLDKLYLFEMVLFAFITGNADMHQKNYSMVETANGWELAPAYDLLNTKLVFPEDVEDSALLIDNRKMGLKKENFLVLGKELGFEDRQIGNAFTRFVRKKDMALDLIGISFLSKDFKQKYTDLFMERFSKLMN